MELLILPERLEKYTHIVNDKVEWNMDTFDETCTSDEFVTRFYYAYTDKYMTMLTCTIGDIQPRSGTIDDILIILATNNYFSLENGLNPRGFNQSSGFKPTWVQSILRI